MKFPVYEETGVKYSWAPESEQAGFKPFKYKWTHIPTGKEGSETVWVLGGEKELTILVGKWAMSSKKWRYYL